MSQFLMVLALSVGLSLGPTFVPVVVSLVHRIIAWARNASGEAGRLRRPVPTSAV